MSECVLHVDFFGRALVRRSCRGGAPGRVGTLLIVSPRGSGEGYAYSTLALMVAPSARMLIDYLYAYLKPGTTLSIHASSKQARVFAAQERRLRLVPTPESA
jgi:hypothetical protein